MNWMGGRLKRHQQMAREFYRERRYLVNARRRAQGGRDTSTNEPAYPRPIQPPEPRPEEWSLNFARVESAARARERERERNEGENTEEHGEGDNNNGNTEEHKENDNHDNRNKEGHKEDGKNNKGEESKNTGRVIPEKNTRVPKGKKWSISPIMKPVKFNPRKKYIARRKGRSSAEQQLRRQMATGWRTEQRRAMVNDRFGRPSPQPSLQDVSIRIGGRRLSGRNQGGSQQMSDPKPSDNEAHDKNKPPYLSGTRGNNEKRPLCTCYCRPGNTNGNPYGLNNHATGASRAPPPPADSGRITLRPNFDLGTTTNFPKTFLGGKVRRGSNVPFPRRQAPARYNFTIDKQVEHCSNEAKENRFPRSNNMEMPTSFDPHIPRAELGANNARQDMSSAGIRHRGFMHLAQAQPPVLQNHDHIYAQYSSGIPRVDNAQPHSFRNAYIQNINGHQDGFNQIRNRVPAETEPQRIRGKSLERDPIILEESWKKYVCGPNNSDVKLFGDLDISQPRYPWQSTRGEANPMRLVESHNNHAYRPDNSNIRSIRNSDISQPRYPQQHMRRKETNAMRTRLDESQKNHVYGPNNSSMRLLGISATSNPRYPRQSITRGEMNPVRLDDSHNGYVYGPDNSDVRLLARSDVRRPRYPWQSTARDVGAAADIRREQRPGGILDTTTTSSGSRPSHAELSNPWIRQLKETERAIEREIGPGIDFTSIFGPPDHSDLYLAEYRDNHPVQTTRSHYATPGERGFGNEIYNYGANVRGNPSDPNDAGRPINSRHPDIYPPVAKENQPTTEIPQREVVLVSSPDPLSTTVDANNMGNGV